MRPAVLCSVMAVALRAACCASANSPPVTHFSGQAHRAISAVPGSVTLYDQNDDDTGVAVISTVFDDAAPTFHQYDSYAADDFRVPSGHKWRIREVDVTGTYALGSDPPLQIEVLFYANHKGLPSGFPLVDCWVPSFVENEGSFAIKLPKSCGRC